MQPMYEPENNDMAVSTVENVLWLYPKLDCLVYDRACAVKSMAIRNENLNQISFYAIDNFHAYGHSKACPCNPRLLDCCILQNSLF